MTHIVSLPLRHFTQQESPKSRRRRLTYGVVCLNWSPLCLESNFIIKGLEWVRLKSYGRENGRGWGWGHGPREEKKDLICIKSLETWKMPSSHFDLKLSRGKLQKESKNNKQLDPLKSSFHCLLWTVIKSVDFILLVRHVLPPKQTHGSRQTSGY